MQPLFVLGVLKRLTISPNNHRADPPDQQQGNGHEQTRRISSTVAVWSNYCTSNVVRPFKTRYHLFSVGLKHEKKT